MTLPSPEHFTDREEALAAYDALWSTTNGPRILNIEGMSGNGKTTLLWFLDYHHPRPADRLHLRLDMSLDNLRTGDYDLPDSLAEQLRAHLPAGALHAYTHTRAQALAEAARIREAAVQVSIHQEAAQGGSISGSPNSVNLEYSQRMADLRRTTRAALLNALMEAGARLKHTPIALLIDTYELVRQGGDADLRAWIEEQILPGLLAALAGLRIVLAGREDLPFRADRNRRNTLRLWNEQESAAFLASFDLDDAALAQAIFNHCQGHPLLTDLAREIWQEGLTQGQPLSASELRSGIDQAAATQWLFERLLVRLPPSQREALRAAALLRELSLDALHALTPAAPLPEDDYHRLLRFSFMQTPPGRAPRVHDLLRQTEEAWLRQHASARHQQLHSAALAYYAARGDSASLDVLYHDLALHPAAGFAAWEEATEQSVFAFDRSRQQALLEMARLPERWQALSGLQQAAWYWWRGQAEYYAAHWAQAEESYQEALGLYRAVGDRQGEANVLLAQGEVLAFLKQSEAALARYEAALGLYRAVGDRLGEANVLRAQGEVLAFLKQSEAALARYEAALGLYRAVGDRLGEANVLRAQGEVLAFLKQSEAALARYREALGLYRAVGSRLGEANVLLAQGKVLAFQAQSEAALARYEEALGLFRAVGDRLGEANVLRAQGEVLAFLKQSEAALARYEEALGLYRAVGDRLGEANVLRAQGEVLAFLKQSEAALARYEAALGLYRAVGDRLGEANVLRAQGEVLAFLKQSEAALARYREALGLYRAVGARLGEANVLRAQGEVLAFLKQSEAALARYEEALGLYRAVGARLGEANVLRAQGEVLAFQDQHEAALTRYREALGLFRAVGSRLGEANVLRAQGEVLAFLKQSEAALARYREALGLYRAVGDRLGEANVLRAQGVVLLDRDDPAAGLARLEEARTLYQAIGARAGLSNVGITLARHAAAAGDLAAAIAHLQPAADFGLEIGHPAGPQLQAQIDVWRARLNPGDTTMNKTRRAF